MPENRLEAPSEFRIATLNAEARTVEVRFATQFPVGRESYKEGRYQEVLECTPEAIDLLRFDAGASLLDSHASYSMRSRIGGVVPRSIRVLNGQAFATIKLSRSEPGDQILRDLEDGIPVPISVGYSILKAERIEAEDGTLPTILATRWQPMELSAVPVPADPNGQARSSKIKSKGRQMFDKLKPKKKQKISAPPVVPEPAVFGLEERSAMAARHLEEADATAFAIAHTTETEAEFRNELLDAMAERQDSMPTMGSVNVVVDQSRSSSANDAVATAIAHRINPNVEMTPEARNYAGAGLHDLARICLQNAGQANPGYDKASTVRGALHGSSDFSLLLSQATGKSLRQLYSLNQSPLRPLFSTRTAPGL